MAKVVMVIGSPRKNSNSEIIADKIAEGAKANGYEIVKYKINDMKNPRGCQGCGACKKAGVCVQNDDIKPLLEDIKVSAGVILATPEYFGQPTAQFRLAQDRFFSFVDGTFTPFFEAGKKVAVVATCGSGYDGAVAMANQIEGVMAGMLRFQPVGKIVVKDAMAPGCVADDKAVMDEALAIGKKF
ncbi:MAG: flavodoxin family protein [Candidatus Methanomethylophilaceae archaeon]|nr:flavodoxin family protein [Candidatus Methanomethylophilaceae archaeon]